MSSAQVRTSPSIGVLTAVLLQVLPMAVLPLPRLTLTRTPFTIVPLTSPPLVPSGALAVLAIAVGAHRVISPAVAAATARARLFPDILDSFTFSDDQWCAIPARPS